MKYKNWLCKYTIIKKMIINVNNNIKRSLEKSDFNKASKLKYFKYYW